MSKRDNLIFLTLLLFSFACHFSSKEEANCEKEIQNKSFEVVSKNEQIKLFLQINDSLKNWISHGLDNYKFEGQGKRFLVDSILCFDITKSRFIGCIFNINITNPNSDGIDFFYGEKLKDYWFFWRGAYLVIPREMIKNQDIHTPLSYQQLHQIALKEVYGGYLKKDGTINEAWFASHFEGPGWGVFEDQPSQDWLLKGKRFTNKKDFFEFLHLQKARSNWPTPDTIGKKLTLP